MIPDLRYNVNHFEPSSHHTVSLFCFDLSCPLGLRDITCVAQNHIAVSNSVDLVNFVLHTELIESGKQFGEKLDNLFGVLDIITELSESNHVSEK